MSLGLSMTLPNTPYFLSWRERRVALAHRIFAKMDAIAHSPVALGTWQRTPTPEIAAYLDDLRQLDGLYAEALEHLSETDEARAIIARNRVMMASGGRDLAQMLEERSEAN